MLKDIVYKNRSYRRFFQERAIPRETLLELVDLARMSPSGRNLQPLKFFIANDPSFNSQIYPLLAWAGYLKEWPGPGEGERPSAYIVMVEDTSIAESSLWDQGIVAQTIMLGAVEKGFGGCILASVKRKELAELLGLHDNLRVALVLALGYPKEVVVVEPLPFDGDIKYWRDSDGVHHVPKRKLEDIVINW